MGFGAYLAKLHFEFQIPLLFNTTTNYITILYITIYIYIHIYILPYKPPHLHQGSHQPQLCLQADSYSKTPSRASWNSQGRPPTSPHHHPTAPLLSWKQHARISRPSNEKWKDRSAVPKKHSWCGSTVGGFSFYMLLSSLTIPGVSCDLKVCLCLDELIKQKNTVLWITAYTS